MNYSETKEILKTDNLELFKEHVADVDMDKSYWLDYVAELAFETKAKNVLSFILNDIRFRLTEKAIAQGFYYLGSVSNLELLKSLINHKDCPDTYDFTHAAIRAAKYGRIKTLKHILQYKHLKINIRSNKIINEAAKNGHLSCVKALLEDERINPSDNDNQAIVSAILYGREKIINILSENKIIQETFTKKQVNERDRYKKDIILKYVDLVHNKKIQNKILDF